MSWSTTKADFSDGSTRRRVFTLLLALAAIGFAILAAWIGLGGYRFGFRPHSLGVDFDSASLLLGIWLSLLVASWSWRRGRFDLFEAPVWFTFNLYGQVVANVWLLQRNYQTAIPWLQQDYPKFMALAVLLIGVALTAMWLAYVWMMRWLQNDRAVRAPKSKSVNTVVVFLMWLGGWVVSNLIVINGINGYLGTGGQGAVWQNYFYFVTIVQTMAGVVLAISHFRAPSIVGWLWLSVVVVSDLVAGLVVGSKTFVFTLVWIAMCILYARGKFPLRWLITSVAVVFLLVPVINAYRLQLHAVDTGAGVALSERVQALEKAIGDMVRQPLGIFVDSTSSTFKIRQGADLDVTASALYLHPAHRPYLGGEMIDYLIPQLIPRIFWPTKPLERSSLFMITTDYFGGSSEYSFSVIGMVADAYRAGGWLFVVVWFVALGMAGAALYKRGPGSNSLVGTAFYIIFVTYFLRYQDPITTTLLQVLQFGILLWFILNWVMLRPATKSAHV